MAKGTVEQLKEYAKCYGGNGNCKKCFGDWNCGGSCHEHAKMLLQDLDIVEVVRCEKCKNLTVHNSPTLYAYCEKTHFRFEPFQTDTRTHFCSYGERRDAE